MQTMLALMIVFLAFVYAGWKFLPARLRGALASKSAAWMQATLRVSPENARRLESKLASGGACGSCDTCKACASTSSNDDPKKIGTLTQSSRAVVPIYKAE